MIRKLILPVLILSTIPFLSGCETINPALSATDTRAAVEPTSGSEQPIPYHGQQLDYGMVFPQNAVNEITITISPENWQAMMEDMTHLYGEQGTGSRPGGGRSGRFPPQGELPGIPGNNRPQGGAQARQEAPGPGMMGGNDDQNPIWVESEITFNGSTWQHVGIRFKGNSSLRTAWSSGSLKFPFKLDFDEFEDQYPETYNQRFFGFKQLSFSSNHHDDSYLREKITADLFREAGVPAAQTAFYAVSIDNGEGLIYLGLYTAVEVVDDTVIETQFKYDGGNVYKPEGAGATFAAGSFSEASFDKETNQEANDYDDILALYDALHAETRTTDPATWRMELEAVFDVDTFLNWLAVNTVIQNWDTYGVMSHNYYLYNNPDTGQLVWIPWDNNESLKSSGGVRDPLSLDLTGVGEEWPLISFLRDDPVYYQQYLSYLEQFLVQVFELEALSKDIEDHSKLIAEYVQEEKASTVGPGGTQARDRAVDDLVQHIQDRISTTENYLDQR